ncbi:MAG TPA: type II secretion system F family protein [Phycisphaerae bacterium]|nr:type II secretion system F family protein [Phycisphaerae bacterium]HRY69866.1 type II secretion system F family protein [Phycisphaerae bacterium]HSA25407.1 type II secretion system F family protein [Phycisphaerae bacterium]
MATFQYEAMNQSGQEVKDEIEAQTTEDALAKIRGLGYYPTKLKQKGGKKAEKAGVAAGGAKKKKAVGGIGRVKVKEITQFTRQLSTLQDAGLPILRSLRILEQQQKPGMMRAILRNVADDIEGGATLSEAMAGQPKAFDRLFCNMVAAGETGGVLDVILQRLADFLERAQRLKRKVMGAMIYPVVVIAFAMGIVAGIMIAVVPKFEEIFKDFGTQLPGMTVVLISISKWFVKGTPPGWVILLFTPVIVILLFKLLRMSEAGRYGVDLVLIKIPVLGNILAKSSVARFTRTLGTLLAAGVPILEAINITKETSGNEVYARALKNVHDEIREGESFANPLRAAKICDGIVVNMIDVGEETGDLDKMLIKIADNYDEEVETLVDGLVSLLEPVMVVVLGGIVGFIVIALFLPLVSLINAVSGGQ